jgi:DNA-binding MarR family transcriptional regulator
MTSLDAFPAVHRFPAALLDFSSMPGHLFRRCKQKSTYVFTELCKKHGVTTIQYGVMKIAEIVPGMDQREVAAYAGLDAATTAGVVMRLERRGLLQRNAIKRRRSLTVTPAGKEILRKLEPLVLEAQKRILHPLTKREQHQLLKLISKCAGVSSHYYKPVRDRSRRW